MQNKTLFSILQIQVTKVKIKFHKILTLLKILIWVKLKIMKIQAYLADVKINNNS
jgi:hypothetical protein